MLTELSLACNLKVFHDINFYCNKFNSNSLRQMQKPHLNCCLLCLTSIYRPSGRWIPCRFPIRNSAVLPFSLAGDCRSLFAWIIQRQTLCGLSQCLKTSVFPANGISSSKHGHQNSSSVTVFSASQSLFIRGGVAVVAHETPTKLSFFSQETSPHCLIFLLTSPLYILGSLAVNHDSPTQLWLHYRSSIQCQSALTL